MDSLKAWWNSWAFADVFAPVRDYALGAYEYVRGKWQEFSDWWNSWKITDIFPDSFSLSWENLNAEDLSSIWDGLTNGFNTAKGLLLSGWETLRGSLNINFSGFWDTLSSGFSTVCDTLKGAWNGVTGFIKDTWDTAADYVSGAWDWTKGLFGFGDDSEAVNQEQLKAQVQDITVLNKMSEGFTQRVAEMTAAWQPFKDSLGEGFEQIYSVMQGIADKIRGVTIPAVNELASALSRIATEIASIVQAVEVHTPNTAAASYSRTFGGRKRAEGGIITRPEISLIGEAGREAIIPLENQTRGAALWFEAGRELGLISSNKTITNTSEHNVMPEIVNAINLQPEVSNIIPHAKGGIFSQPHIGLVAEAGREAVIPLENQTRGAALWFEAGRELGLILGENSTTSNAYSSLNAPAITNSNATIKPSERNTVSMLNKIISGGSKQFSNILSSSTRIIEGGNSLNAFSLISSAVNNLRNSGMGIPELGGMNVLNRISTQSAGVMPSIMNAMNFQPMMPGIGDLFPPMYTEQGESPSLEDTTRNIPLWLWAEKDIGGSFSSSTTNNNRPVTISPSFNITVNGGESGIEQKFRRIIEEILSDIQDREARTRFD